MKNTQLLQENGVTQLKFSKNGAYCSIATKKNVRVYVFEVKTFNDINTWNILQEIKEHMQTVSSIDWAADQKIITASHDRSVFVWNKNNQNKWDKMLVNVDVKLSVMASQWSPNNKKFAIASCPTTLILGFYNSQQKCWTAVTKEKLLKAPAITLDFHPSSNILAVGCVDGSVKVVSCSFGKYTDPKDPKSNVDNKNNYKGPFQKIDTLWDVVFSIDTISPKMTSWINYVGFQNNGSQLMVLPHSSHIKIFDVTQDKILVNQRDISHNGLPFMNGYISNQKQQMIVSGFDKKVAIFAKSGDSYKFSKYLQKNQKTNKSKKKGIVDMMMKGIEKKEWNFGDAPGEDQHQNTVKVNFCRNTHVSFDLSGTIHFWE